jgi:hypothetical protein
LRGGGVVEIDQRLAVHRALEDGKLITNGFHDCRGGVLPPMIWE